MQYEDDRKEKKRRDEMERQARVAREARAAELAAAATTSQNTQQRNEDASGASPDGDELFSNLPVHEDEQTEESDGRSPSPEAPASVDDNSPTSTSRLGTPPQVSVRFV